MRHSECSCELENSGLVHIAYIYIYGTPPPRELSTSFGLNTVYSPDPQFKRLLCACVCVYFEP